MTRCSICHTLVQPADAAVTCDACTQEFHRTCWNELGGCATYGCTRAAEAGKPAPLQTVGAGWGDTKGCPACGQTIGSGLLVCRCGATFPYADPMTRPDFVAWRKEGEAASRLRRTLAGLFIASLTGLPAPVTGGVAVWIAWRSRKRLEGSDGTYLAMGYGAAALGATYTLMILLLALGF